MKKNTLHISVLHIDTEKSWRGGQQQVAYLIKNLAKEFIQSILVCPPQSPLHEFCLDNHLPCEPVRMRGEMDFLAVLKLVRLVKKFKVNILHAHSSHAQMLALWVKLLVPGIKIITVRRVDFHIKKSFPARTKYTSPKIDVIATVSNRIKDVLISDGIPSEKIQTIYSGVDLSKYESINTDVDLSAEFHIPGNHKIVGTVAALAGHKDYPSLLKAAQLVIREREDITFLALGDGPQEKILKKLHHELQLNNRFIFAGFRNIPLAYMKKMDLFVLSSKLEGLGTSLLDARALNIPIVATRTGGIPEALDNGQSGLLVEPQKPEALAHAILYLLDHPEICTQLVQHSATTIEKFSVDHMVDQYMNLYEELMFDKITRKK